MIGELEGYMVTFQHSPMNVKPSENIEHIQETVVMVASKWLGKKVSSIVRRWDLFEEDQSGLDEFMKIMVTNVDTLISLLWK